MNIQDITLTHGAHDSRDSGVCAMEAIAWVMGEDHSDFPACTPRPIATVFQRVNDWLDWEDDGERTAFLLPYLERLMSCVGCEAPDVAYGYAAADLAVRVFAAEAVSRCSATYGAKLAALGMVVDHESALLARDAADAAFAAADAAFAAFADAAVAANAANAANATNAAYNAAAAAGAAAAAADAGTYKRYAGLLLTRLLDVMQAGQWPLPLIEVTR